MFNYIFNFVLAGVSALVSPIGLLVVGLLSDKFGRKIALLFLYALAIVGWLILANANSYEVILIGRTILGTTFGKNFTIYLKF